MQHDARKSVPRASPSAARSERNADAMSPMAAGLRKLEALRIEPDIELHRSSSGRNIRLKHCKAPAVASPHGLMPRAPERKRPPELLHARKRSISAHGDLDDDDERFREKTPTSTSTPATPTLEAPLPSPENNQAGSVPKPRRVSGKREDRRSSFMIHEPWEQLGFARALGAEHDPPIATTNQETSPTPLDIHEEKAAASLHHIAEHASPLPSTKREVYQFALWKNAGRNRRLDDAISGYDSAPSPPRPSPPRPPSTKRRSSSADRTGDNSPHSVYESARVLAGRHGFGRHHHVVETARVEQHDATESNAPDLSLTRSTSPVINGGAGRRSHQSLSVPQMSGSDAIVRWRRGDLLGEGTFGKVHKCLNADTGEFFALKEIEIREVATDDQMRQLQKLSEEIEVMHSLRHDHIVRYKGSHRTNKHFYIFMEFVPGGSIASNLKQFGAFDEDLVRNYTRQIVDGVVYLHEKDIIHRDIKGANVLVTDQGVAKLADFGCSKRLPEIITTSLEESLRSIRGSIPWMAPEVVRQTGHSLKADIWSIGATVIEMATGRHPWPAMTNGLAGMYMIATAKSSPPIPDHLSDEAKSFLARCFCIDPEASFSLMVVYIFNQSRAVDPLILSNRPSGFQAEGANGVHPDVEENDILEFAEPTLRDGLAPPTKKFAYMFYVTHENYACAALHAMQRLVHELHMDTNRIDIVVLYSHGVSADKIQLMEKTVSARPIPIARILADDADLTWQESLTKFRAFEDFGYKRVVFIDSDAVPLQNLDDLFLLPPAPLYAPTAYWLAQPFFTTSLMVIEPSNNRFLRILQFARTHSDSLHFDMEILNAFFRKTAVYLPPEYAVLNSDFRTAPSTHNAVFQVATSELRTRAKLVHFSSRPDGSYGKPWDVETREISFLEVQGFDPFFGQLFVDYWHTEKLLCVK